MSKPTKRREQPDQHNTQNALDRASYEAEHVAHPHHSGVLAWFIALSTGAWIFWRGTKAALQDRSLKGGERDAERIEPPFLREQSEEPQHRNGASLHTPHDGAGHTHNRALDPTDAVVPPVERTVPTAAEPRKLRGGVVELLKEFITRYNADDCPARAAALSFFGLLSLVPLMLFAVAALGFFIHDPNQARQYVEHVVAGLLPGKQASSAADQVIRQTNLVDSARALMQGKWWSILFGFLSLVYSGLGLFVNAADPINAAWEVKETRSFLKLRLVCLEVFAGAGLFFLLSLAVSADLWHPAGAPWIVNACLTVFYEALAIALNGIMFTLVYRFLPNTRVSWRAAGFGGAATGLLYEIAKKGFEFYLTHFGNLNNKMYGALGGIVLLVTWIYYGSMLLLAGAIVAKMYHEHREQGGVQQKQSSPR